jgi:hypothetical protein
MSLLLASTVLVIGNSHLVGPFGWYLDENLRNSGLQVATYASCGSIAKWWTSGQKTTCGYFSKNLKGEVVKATTHSTPNLAELLGNIRPETVLVELGANYVNTPSDSFAINDLKTMVKTIKDAGARCYWIGSPDSRKYRAERPRIYRLITEAVGADCPIFNSMNVTQYPESGGDGVHYWFKEGMPIARNWADAVAEDFLRDPSLY